MKALTCETCGAIVSRERLPVECVQVANFWHLDSWWHRECASLIVVNDAYRLCEFPSPGKMIPNIEGRK
jgi:hypothetical protein